MKPWGFSLVLLFAIGVDTPSFAETAVSHPAPSEEKNECLLRRPLSSEDQLQLNVFRKRLASLYFLRSSENDEADRAYHRELSQIIRESSPKMTSPELIEKAIEALIEEELNDRLEKSVGLNAPEVREFRRAQMHIHDYGSRNVGKFGEVVDRLTKRLLKYYPKPSAERDRTLGLFQLVTEDLARDAQLNLEIRKDKNAVWQTAGKASLGAAGFTVALAGAAPLVGAGATVAGPLGVVAAGCAIGTLGGGSVTLLEDSYHAASIAYQSSSKHGTSFSCEMRRHLAQTQGHTLKATTEGMLIGLASGCAIVTGALTIPVTTAVSVTAAVGGIVLYEGYGMVEDGRKGYSKYKAYQSALSRARRLASPCVGGKGQDRSLMGIYESAQALDHLTQSQRTSEIYEGLRAFLAAEAEAREKNFELAREHLEKARSHFWESGEKGLNLIITGILLKGLSQELYPALKEGGIELAKEIAAAGDELPAVVKIFVALFKQPVIVTKVAAKAAAKIAPITAGKISGPGTAVYKDIVEDVPERGE